MQRSGVKNLFLTKKRLLGKLGVTFTDQGPLNPDPSHSKLAILITPITSELAKSITFITISAICKTSYQSLVTKTQKNEKTEIQKFKS